MSASTATQTVRSPAYDNATRPTQWLWALGGVAILVVMLFPVYWMLNVSLQPAGSAVGTPWFPAYLSLDGYQRAIQDQGRYLLISLVIALGAVVFSLIIAAPAAYALAKFNLRFVGPILLAILISQMVPGIVVANALYSIYNDLGLLNSIPGLILADSSLGIPFAMLLMTASMRSLPSEVMEAASVDGAGDIRTFLLVVLPMSRNALVTAGLFTFLFAWGDFLFALTLTTTPDVRPVTLGLYTYTSGYVNDWSSVMATAVLASLPAIALLVLGQRFVAAGTTAGAVK